MICKTMLFNPFTGWPRHPDDIKSDPAGILIWDGEEPLKAAQAPETAQDHRSRPIEHADRISPEGISAVLGAMQEAGAAEAVKLVPIVPTPEMVFALLAVPEIDDAKADIEAMWAAMLAAAPGIEWPKPLPRKGQSPVLFDDGYEEGWAKCIDTMRTIFAPASKAAPAGNGQAGVEELHCGPCDHRCITCPIDWTRFAPPPPAGRTLTEAEFLSIFARAWDKCHGMDAVAAYVWSEVAASTTNQAEKS